MGAVALIQGVARPSAAALPVAGHGGAAARGASTPRHKRRALANAALRIARPAGELILWLALIGWLLLRIRPRRRST